MLVRLWQRGCEARRATRQCRRSRRRRKGPMLILTCVPNHVGWFPSKSSEKGAGGQKGGRSERSGCLDLARYDVGFGTSRGVGRR